MRTATSNDVWRALYKRTDFPIRRVRVDYSSVTALGNGSVSFDKPLSLVCGENGVGKTTLLRVVQRGLMQGVAEWDEIQNELPQAAMSGEITSIGITIRSEQGDTEIASQAGFEQYRAQREPPSTVQFIDTATLIPSILRLLRADKNRHDLIEGVTPRLLVDDDLADVRQLVGRDYEQVEIFEIAEYHDFEVLPYFRVKAGGVTYASESMGTGELALLHLFWAIQASPQASVVLLEEPESFVAPRSQRVLIDWLANLTIEKKLFVVVASHSGLIAERFPQHAVALCSRAGETAVVQPSPPIHMLVERLGILSHRRCLILVEDAAAEALANALIRELEPRLHTECDIVQASSNGKITAALKNLPLVRSKKIVAIGLYDGDQAATVSEGIDWPTAFLPGGQGPEVLVREICQTTPAADIANALGIQPDAFAAALGGAEGKDPHDWLTSLVTTLELDIKTFVRSVIPFWIRSHAQDALSFAERIGAAARRPF